MSWFWKRKKKIKPGKESGPPSPSRLEELPSPVARATVTASSQTEMWPTAGRDYHTQPSSPYQHGRPVRTIRHQPTIEESRLMIENARLTTTLQQVRNEYARVEAALIENKRVMQDWILRQRQRDERQRGEERKIRDTQNNLRKREDDLRIWESKLQKEQNALWDTPQKLLQSRKCIIQLEHDNRILQHAIDDATSHINALKEELRHIKHRLDSAKNEITEKETELWHVREELDEERNNKVGPREESEEKLSRLQSEKDMLEQKLQEATRKLELKDNHTQRTLQDKDDEIAQMKDRASKTEYELRQCEEERDKEAKRAFKDISYLTDKNKILQHKLSATDECLERMRKDFETEYQQLKTQAAAEIERLKTKYHILKADIEAHKTERDSLKTEKDSLETKIDSLRDERDYLQRQYTEAKAVAENFQYRLSKEFSIRLASDETNMENISVKHRPAKIAEKFAQIESKEWVEAKEVLDDTCDEKTSIRLLLNMLEFACKRAQQVFDGFLSSEACRLYSPIAAISKTLLEDQNGGGFPQVPGSILKEITAFLKGTCGECDIQSLTQSVVDRLKEMHGEEIVPILQDTNVRAFLQTCCRLAWQMAVQQPPLTVVTYNIQYDDRWHQLWYNSPSPSRSKGVSRGEIDFYIWPELRQAENVLQRGRVCLKPRNIVCSVTPLQV